MDYTQSSVFYKLKKGIRYWNLYGVMRTIGKIEAQYHMHREYQTLPPQPTTQNAKAHVGLGLW
jgi:hypothetical protein